MSAQIDNGKKIAKRIKHSEKEGGQKKTTAPRMIRQANSSFSNPVLTPVVQLPPNWPMNVPLNLSAIPPTPNPIPIPFLPYSIIGNPHEGPQQDNVNQVQVKMEIDGEHNI